MEENSGVTVQAVRYGRLPLPTQPLSEGVTPTAVPLQLETVTAILEQWGLLVQLTDKAVLTVTHPVMRVATTRVGEAMGQLWDREIQEVLRGGSTIVFPNAVTAASSLGASDVVSADLMRKVLATLRNNGARQPFTLVVDNYVSQDIQKDSLFRDRGAYQDKEVLQTAVVGKWLGFQVRESNLIPIQSLLASSQYTGTAANTTVPGGETGFTASSTVPVVITRLDPIFGHENTISAAIAITNGAAFVVDVIIPSAAATGVYRVYVGLEGAAVATQQLEINHVTGTADTRTFIKAGTPSGVNRFIVQATGAVAPAAMPATGNVHTTYAIAAEAFGVTKLGKRIETMIVGAGAQKSDPLDQRRYVGAKTFFKSLLLNQDFIRVIQSTSVFN